MKEAVKDDTQLIEATLAGDTAAYGQLVTRYQDRLYNTLVHVCGSAEDAADITQDAMVQAFVKLSSFGGRSAFYTWLYRIAFNLAISQKRRKRSTVSADQLREASGEEPLDESEMPEDRMLQEERVEQVQVALTELSEEHRTILVLREMEGCCYETISDILDLPVGTVRSRLHRARMQLRDQLKQVLHGEEWE